MVDTYGIGARATAKGGAVVADDGDIWSTYYNPAALADIRQAEISLGTTVLDPEIRIRDYSVAGVPVASHDIDNESSLLVVPHLGFAMPVSGKVTFGLAAYVPWGMRIDWNDSKDDDLGTRNSMKAHYLREVVTPTLSFKVNERMRIGAGISLGRSLTGNTFYSDTFNQVLEAELEDDFNISANLGFQYVADRYRFGITYRGRTEADFEGDLVGARSGKEASVELNYDHPEQVQIGFQYQPERFPKLTLELDTTWTNWSINKSQDEYLTPALPSPYPNPVSIPRNWEDTWAVRFGADYRVSDALILRAGYVNDPSPIPDSAMDFIWPDADKDIWTLGAGYTKGAWTFDLALGWAQVTNDRHIKGNSDALNLSYGKRPVSFDATGHIPEVVFTLTRRF